MKKTILTLMLLSLFTTSCTLPDIPKRVERCSNIAEKASEIGNRFSEADFFFGKGSVTKSQTVYFFILGNGSTEEVGRDEYYKSKVGELFCWEEYEYITNS